MSKYQNVPALANPARDAAAMGDLFKSAGFDSVDTKLDLTITDLRRAIRDFAGKTASADIAVVYYAGHGIEVNGSNYLIPTDAKLASDYDIPDETFALDRLLDALEPAKRLRLVILDACRDNPFDKTMKRSIGTRSIGRGLAKVDPMSSNTLVAFAARAGAVAADGSGTNSPFAAALMKYITAPGLELRLALGKVRDDVVLATNNKQEPFLYGSLGGDALALNPVAVLPSATTAAPSDPELIVRRDYEFALQVGSRAVWDTFIATYPTGLYSEFAKAQRNRIIDDEALRAVAADKNKVASLSPDQSTPRSDGPVAVGDIPRQLQVELRRVGCNTGSVSDTWTPAAQKSMELFNRNAGMKLDVKVASIDSLDAVKSKPGRVCPLTCERGYQVDGDRCTRITCKAGYEVGDDNTCQRIEVRRPAPVARQDRDPPPRRVYSGGGGGGPSPSAPLDCNGPMGFANCVAHNLAKDRH
ncbi:MAG: caspase family protein [Afipia sp.]|nr:caspase family protein [Afipia sp.]